MANVRPTDVDNAPVSVESTQGAGVLSSDRSFRHSVSASNGRNTIEPTPNRAPPNLYDPSILAAAP
jgi:hypothetical protein